MHEPFGPQVGNADRPYGPPAHLTKNSGIAAVLSFLWIGLGQIYNGSIGKGIVLLLISIVFAVITAFTCGIGLILYLPLWVYGIYDAYEEAERINRRAAGRYR